MGGRHRSGVGVGRGVRMGAASLAVLTVLTASWYGLRLISRPACGTPLRISVGAAPELAPTVQAEVAEWASTARVAGQCVAIDVAAADPADLAAALAGQAGAKLAGVGEASGAIKLPDVWIPDSSIWLQRLRAAKAGSVPDDAPSIARTPVVVAAPEPIATQLGWPQAKLTWAALLTRVTVDTQVKVGIVEPTRDATGLSGLLALAAAAQAAGAGATQASTAALRALAQGRKALREELLRSFPRASDPSALATSLSVAPLSEQAVIAYNALQPPVRLAPLYVEPAPAQLDYPFVTTAGVTGDRLELATELRKRLGTATFRDRLGSIGMRSGDGTAGATFKAPSNAPANAVVAATLPDGAVIDRLLSTWQSITLPSRMLAVVDVSGSMKAPVPTAGNATRMAVTLEAARRGMSLFDDSWAVGLWTFSIALDGDKDYKQILPIAPLSAQRAQMIQAIGTIQPTNGDTGLYDTILAGYKEVLGGWQEGRVNSLVVLTDGRNEDANGIELPALLNELKALVDKTKPISVILIGIGTTVGKAEMEQITATVGGGTFLAPDPAKIGEIFLQAIALRAAQ